ncbi:hypothetical protein [Opitutus sp. ER46]|uniref:hypothetical protein n=1 Tax=Opitutus sp. ER46 TaxID=2161864 RepID=UPI000D31C59C|nr:hypothetical protein [Opitutus sp. ER46]PTX94376.1 hypothetical protein DB354_11520 [Opitutus sp. ER46]
MRGALYQAKCLGVWTVVTVAAFGVMSCRSPGRAVSDPVLAGYVYAIRDIASKWAPAPEVYLIDESEQTRAEISKFAKSICLPITARDATSRSLVLTLDGRRASIVSVRALRLMRNTAELSVEVFAASDGLEVWEITLSCEAGSWVVNGATLKTAA